MIDKKQIERFFDYVDQFAIEVYGVHKKPYLEAMNEAFIYLLDDELNEDYIGELKDKLKTIKDTIVDVSFEREEVRKAVQLALLRGYKHANVSNSLITPDTIGIFIAYLIKKLYNTKGLNSILDPLVGTGNLLYTVINHLELDIKASGIDNDITKCNITKNLGDLLDIENEVYYQDTLSFYYKGYDLILTDIDDDSSSEYFPYKVINHHIDSLEDGGFLVAVIANDFFEQEKNQIFREEIQKKGYIFGLIKLSETLFTQNPKSILIIQKKGIDVEPVKEFLLVDLPSFNDIENFNKSLNQIDQWFSKREVDLS